MKRRNFIQSLVASIALLAIPYKGTAKAARTLTLDEKVRWFDHGIISAQVIDVNDPLNLTRVKVRFFGKTGLYHQLSNGEKSEIAELIEMWATPSSVFVAPLKGSVLVSPDIPAYGSTVNVFSNNNHLYFISHQCYRTSSTEQADSYTAD